MKKEDRTSMRLGKRATLQTVEGTTIFQPGQSKFSSLDL